MKRATTSRQTGTDQEAPDPLSSDHVDSELLALCAVRSDEVSTSHRKNLDLHLERCFLCREELVLVREAVQQARPADAEVLAMAETVPAFLAATSTHPPLASRVAATVIFLLLGSAVLLGGLSFLDVLPQRFAASPPSPTADPVPVPTAPVDQIYGRDLEGVQLIDTEKGLSVSQLTVRGGADVTFRSPGVVAFGDGFRVAEGARITVGSDSGETGAGRGPVRN